MLNNGALSYQSRTQSSTNSSINTSRYSGINSLEQVADLEELVRTAVRSGRARTNRCSIGNSSYEQVFDRETPVLKK